MTRVTRFSTIGLGLILAAAATAQAATAIRWQPTRMQHAIVAAKYPDGKTTAARCTGLGKRRRTGYVAFRCIWTWTLSDGTRTETHQGASPIWARPLRAGRFCASTISLTHCKPYGP